MSDDAVRLLAEIRDLLREQAERQLAAAAQQRQAADAYQRLLRRSLPLITLALLLVLAVLVVLFLGVWRRV